MSDAKQYRQPEGSSQSPEFGHPAIRALLKEGKVGQVLGDGLALTEEGLGELPADLREFAEKMERARAAAVGSKS